MQLNNKMSYCFFIIVVLFSLALKHMRASLSDESVVLLVTYDVVYELAIIYTAYYENCMLC